MEGANVIDCQTLDRERQQIQECKATFRHMFKEYSEDIIYAALRQASIEAYKEEMLKKGWEERQE